MAEGVMKHLAEKHALDWIVDSAGTEYYHVGESPDYRAVQICRNNQIDITSQRARRITKSDFQKFDLIYALADDVLDELLHMKPHHTNGLQLKLLMDEVFPGRNESVPDPWYGSMKDFDVAFRMIHEACEAIISRYANLQIR